MPLDTYLQTGYTGSGGSNVFYAPGAKDELTEVFIGLANPSSSVSTYELFMLNAALDTWVLVPGATQLSDGGTKSMLATLPAGHYCLRPTAAQAETGTVDIKVGGKNVILDAQGITASF